MTSLPPVKARFDSPLWHCAVLLVGLPAVMTVFLPDWMYAAPDHIDDWVYNGFFRHLPSYASTLFPGTYYGSRLGWIVPGYFAYHVFEPRVASLVLHLTFYSLAVGSLYVILRRMAGSSAAFFVAVTFGLYLPTIRAHGSDLVDSPVIAYALLAVALGMDSVEHVKRWAMFGSGIAVGAMLNCNIGAVFLVPSIVVCFVPLQREVWLSKAVYRQAMTWCAGIIACTAALSVASRLAGGRWAFFMQSVTWLAANFNYSSGVTGVAWLPTAPWVFLPLSTVIASGVVCFRSRGRLSTAQVRSIAALFLSSAAFALWDFVGPGAVLYWPFYVSWLTPWTFLVAGTVLIPSAPRPRAEVAILVTIALLLGVSMTLFPSMQLPGFGLRALGVTLFLVLVAALAAHATASRLAFAAGIACLNVWISMTGFYSPGTHRADAFGAIDRSVGIIDRYVGPQRRPKLLLASPTKLALYVRGLASVYLFAYTIVSEQFPKVTAEQAALIDPGAVVVVIAEQADTAAVFDEVFAPFGLRGVRRGIERVETALGPLYLTFFEAKARS